MAIKNIYFNILSMMLLAPLLFSSCKEEELNLDLFSGLWVQEQITEDGQPMALSNKEKTLRLLIENNGVYRSFATDGNTSDEHYGTWIVTDGKWIDFTIDIWQIKTKPTEESPTGGTWTKNHVLNRFSILSIAKDKMEIRIKTYLGEKKYSTLFVDNGRPDLILDNIAAIENEFKTYKTYIFTFKKEQ